MNVNGVQNSQSAARKPETRTEYRSCQAFHWEQQALKRLHMPKPASAAAPHRDGIKPRSGNGKFSALPRHSQNGGQCSLFSTVTIASSTSLTLVSVVI